MLQNKNIFSDFQIMRSHKWVKKNICSSTESTPHVWAHLGQTCNKNHHYMSVWSHLGQEVFCDPSNASTTIQGSCVAGTSLHLFKRLSVKCCCKTMIYGESWLQPWKVILTACWTHRYLCARSWRTRRAFRRLLSALTPSSRRPENFVCLLLKFSFVVSA